MIVVATNEEIFYKEFNQMVYQLKANNGVLDLNTIPLPSLPFRVEQREQVVIGNIEVDYYSKLNDSEALLWSNGQLKRRKFDYKGEFMKDKNGNQIFTDVTLPHNCVAVISPIQIGVPLKFKTEEHFEFVDTINRNNPDGTKTPYYIYIIPRKYCFKLNQVALVINTNKMRVYYDGLGITLRNGNTVYLYTIPYKPTQQQKGYRVLHTKTTNDFSAELVAIRDYWLEKGYMFNPAKCVLNEGVKGRENVALQLMPTVLDEYIRFDPSVSLDSNSDEFILEEDDLNG